jgi:hypothetical protein
MSEHGVHVHGPHDHAVEHEAHKTPLGQQVAIFTAVLATVGAIVSFFGGDGAGTLIADRWLLTAAHTAANIPPPWFRAVTGGYGPS